MYAVPTTHTYLDDCRNDRTRTGRWCDDDSLRQLAWEGPFDITVNARKIFELACALTFIE